MRNGAGLAFALGSCVTFALSGMFASALIDSGWSSGAVTTTRIVGAALVLLVPSLLAMRGRWSTLRRASGHLIIFGVFAVTVAQLGFFSAVQFIPPALALVIEFLGPVLLVLWTWARTRRSPTGLTIAGIVVAVLGLVLVAGVGAGSLDPIGVLLALTAAVGNAVYWATAASSTHGIPPVALAGFGLGIGGVLLAVVSAVGLLPFTVSSEPAVLVGVGLDMVVVVGALIAIATVAPYVLGIAGARRLGPTVASFVGYTEPLFGVLWMAVLLAILPSGTQWLGAGAIVAGVVLVRLGQVRADRTVTGATPIPAG